MSVKQFNASWSAAEDRLLFNFNTTQSELFQFWLTRLLVKTFLEQSQKIISLELGVQHDKRSSQIIYEFQKEQVKKQLTLGDSFEGGQSTPLGNAPVLATGVQMSLEQQVVTISLNLVTGQTVSFHLPLAQLQALIVLLEGLASHASWGIGELSEGLVSEVFVAYPQTPSQWH